MALRVETRLAGTRSCVEMHEKCGPRNHCHVDELSCTRLACIEAGAVLRHFRKSCAGPFIVTGLNKQLSGSMQNPRRNQVPKFDAETMVGTVHVRLQTKLFLKNAPLCTLSACQDVKENGGTPPLHDLILSQCAAQEHRGLRSQCLVAGPRLAQGKERKVEAAQRTAATFDASGDTHTLEFWDWRHWGMRRGAPTRSHFFALRHEVRVPGKFSRARATDKALRSESRFPPQELFHRDVAGGSVAPASCSCAELHERCRPRKRCLMSDLVRTRPAHVTSCSASRAGFVVQVVGSQCRQRFQHRH